MTVPYGDDDALFASFFDLTTTGELGDFIAALDPDEGTVEAALIRYAATWPALSSGRDASFDPAAHVSRDLTAALYGTSPCVFLGTNNWAVSATMSREAALERVVRMGNAITRVAQGFEGRPTTVIVVPEKDFAIDYMFRRTGAYEGITGALDELKGKLADVGIRMVFLEPLVDLERFIAEDELSFPDTHLLPRMYLQYVGFAMLEMGYDWDAIHTQATLERHHEFMDLSEKLNSVAASPKDMMVPMFRQSDLRLVEGHETFQTPLRQTWQRVENASPIMEGSVLLLGDSHSSIVQNNKLTKLFASVFRSCEFHWNPCGVNGNVPETASDHLVLEISQRFVFS